MTAPPALARRRRRHRRTACKPTPPSPAARRLHALEFSSSKVIRSVHTGGVACLDLDAVEQRYLLAGAGDASIAIYDTQAPSAADKQAAQEAAREAAGTEAALTSNQRYLRPSGQAEAARTRGGASEHAALAVVSKQTPGAHRFSVSAVAWYPVDCGLFVSGARARASRLLLLLLLGAGQPAERQGGFGAALDAGPPTPLPPNQPRSRHLSLPLAGGFDSEVKVWDANSLQVVSTFALDSRVYAAAMSAVATSHCLVAVGSGDTQVGALGRVG